MTNHKPNEQKGSSGYEQWEPVDISSGYEQQARSDSAISVDDTSSQRPRSNAISSRTLKDYLEGLKGEKFSHLAPREYTPFSTEKDSPETMNRRSGPLNPKAITIGPGDEKFMSLLLEYNKDNHNIEAALKLYVEDHKIHRGNEALSDLGVIYKHIKDNNSNDVAVAVAIEGMLAKAPKNDRVVGGQQPSPSPNSGYSTPQGAKHNVYETAQDARYEQASPLQNVTQKLRGFVVPATGGGHTIRSNAKQEEILAAGVLNK